MASAADYDMQWCVVRRERPTNRSETIVSRQPTYRLALQFLNAQSDRKHLFIRVEKPERAT
jgi:hypothetical protein